MINKKFWPGMLMLALAFGTAIIGCDNGTNAGSAGGVVGGPADITYIVAANGKSEKETTTQLTFTFSAAVSDLKVEDITIYGNTGEAAKNGTAHGGVLTGGGTSWTLNINNVREGKIRVNIDKKGIELGRKTVFVYKDNASGLSPEEAITLLNTQWLEQFIVVDTPRWYKYEAEEGAEYRVQWRDRTGIPSGSQTPRVYVSVTVYKSDHETIISGNTENGPIYGWSGWPISGETGMVYIKVETHDSKDSGTFAIRFLDIEDMGPKDLITVLRAYAQTDFSIEVAWEARSVVPGNPVESTGYKVYRSETEDGDYKLIDDVPSTKKEEDLYEFPSYTDTNEGKGLTPGKSYWYKVAGYNSKGAGDMSEPKESTVVQDIDTASIELTPGTETEGEFTKDTQIDLYKFEAQSGKKYSVKWVPVDEGPMVLMISAYLSDKTPIAGYYGGEGETFSGVSGTVYLEVSVSSYFYSVFGYVGPYTIKVSEE